MTKIFHPLLALIASATDKELAGETVTFYTQVPKIGRTSISVHVAVHCERDGREVNLTEAEVAYVAVEIDGKTLHPVPIRDERD